MPETPKKVEDVVGKAVATLNHDWDLQLPRLHGGAAEAAESTSAVARRCSARLRYLSFRLDSLEPLLEDFDARARQLYARWTSKPLQENGTLPRFPVTKSNIANAVKRGRALGLDILTKEQRDTLLQVLDDTIKDDYDLSRDFDSYQPTSSTQPSRPPSHSEAIARRQSPRNPGPGMTTTRKPNDSSRPLHRSEDSLPQLPPAKMPPKRVSSEASRDPPKRKRVEDDLKQRKLVFGKPALSPVPPLRHPPPPPTAALGPTQSFDTTASSVGSDIFDSPLALSKISSTDTSILDTEKSQDYFPTQEAIELLEDLAVQRSLEASAPSTSSSFSANDIPQRLQSTFVAASGWLPPDLPFDYIYELNSLAIAATWTQEPLDIYKEVQKRYLSRLPDFDERAAEYSRMWKARDLSVPEVFGAKAWRPLSEPGKEGRQSIYLSANLTWAKASHSPLFKVTLKRPDIDKSCRFHRIFGGDRFLTLRVPFVSDLPQQLMAHKATVNEHLQSWLSTTHTIASRQWKAFWVDDKPPKIIKEKTSKGTKEKPSFNRVYLFAISGIGLSDISIPLSQRAMSVAEFINYHAPIQENLESTDLKFFARFKLGLSKTIPTIVLEQTQFREVPELIGDGNSVMNDGCALMSVALARDITRHIGLDQIPTAIQGRISGAKGLWIVDFRDVGFADKEYWIEVSSSQLKIKPHPSKRNDTIHEYRRFEVSAWSSPSEPAPLNTQFVTILKDRGVPKTVLENCLYDEIIPYNDDLQTAMREPCLLRKWMQENHSSSRDGEVEMLGAFPRARNDAISSLLDAGFDGQDRRSPLRDLLTCNLRDHLSWWVEKVKIVIEETVYLYCIVDPCGVLNEDEVHLSLSNRWIDPRTGISSGYVAGVDGLVARSPANLPSDIQRIQFVFKPELDRFRDVLIFSSKGQRSLASLLSGGDYDGDQCWACWNPKIVENFINWPGGPPDDITPEDCGLSRRGTPLSTTFTASSLSTIDVDVYLQKCIGFNLELPPVGKCTSEHERVVYQKSLRDPGAIKLAALASYLVDARKQGLHISDESYNKIRLECSGKRSLPAPAYKSTDSEAPGIWKRDNIIDHLRFGVASPERHRILEEFSKIFPRNIHYATHLADPWNAACKEAKGDSNAEQTLSKLKSDIHAVFGIWQSLTGNSMKADADASQFPQSVRRCHEEYLLIVPGTESDRLSWIFRAEKDRQHSYWRVLRASCFYVQFPKTRLTWYMAGDELCFMQASQSPNIKNLTSRMHSIMKVDTKAVKNRFVVDDEEDFDLS